MKQTLFTVVVLLVVSSVFAGPGGDDPSVSLEGVFDLTPDNFDSIVNGDKAAIVEFYAPWCGHCKRLVETYGALGKLVASSKSDVVIAKVNADAHKELGSRFGVSGFPTIKFFPKGSKTAEEYKGGRELEDFVEFLNSKANAGLKVTKAPSFVVAVDDLTFDSVVMNAEKDVLVEFYAPWCGHCKKLAPEYEKLANAYRNDKNVAIVKIDSDKHKQQAQKYGVSGFPTLKFFPKGNKAEPLPYDGPRTLDAMVEFINKHAGTKRMPNGALSDIAGRVEALDKLSAVFLGQADEAKRNDMIAEAQAIVNTLTGEEATSGQYYLKAMQKGAEFIIKERQRLQKMQTSSVSGTKADDQKRRINILASFFVNQPGATPV